MIVMINGYFGVGKTSVAKRLVERIPNSMIYDPEEIGIAIRNIISIDIMDENEKTEDFQDIYLWRKMVIKFAEEIKSKYGRHLIIPMTIKNKEYFDYIYKGLSMIDEEIYHFCLTASIETIKERLYKRGEIEGNWCIKETESCVNGFLEERFSEYIDTENKSIDDVEKIIMNKLKGFSNKLLVEEYLGKKEYIIRAPRLNINILNSAHQSIKQIHKKKTYYEILVEIHPLFIQQQLDFEDFEMYLMETKSIESNSLEIKGFTKRIIENETDKFKIIEKVLNFTRNIKQDNNLALEIYNGRKTQSAVNTIKRNIGTCSESTNLFIGVMRSLGVPSKFILGKRTRDLYHTWAEVFIENMGWIPVETQINIPIDSVKGYFGITNRHIKTHEGIDFESLNIKLSMLEIDIKDIVQ